MFLVRCFSGLYKITPVSLEEDAGLTKDEQCCKLFLLSPLSCILATRTSGRPRLEKVDSRGFIVL